jgi:hypothetical protein
MNPTIGIAGCCARAASGHATAMLPNADMNCRRPIPIVIDPAHQGTRPRAISAFLPRFDIGLREISVG